MNNRKKRNLISLEKKQARYGYLFISPLILGAILVFFPNMINTFIFTLNDITIVKGGYELGYVGLKNYSNAFLTNATYPILLVQSLVSLLIDIPVILIFSLFIAVVINQQFKGRVFARAIFFVPVLLATGIIAKVEQTSGLMNFIESSRVLETGTTMDNISLDGINNILISLNFNQTLINIVVGAANNIYSVVLSSGIQIFIFLAALQEIPSSLYEAAKVEGCDGWQLFWKITIPMISPQILVNSIYTVVDTFTDPNSELFQYFDQVAFVQNQYGYATAMSWIYFMCIAVIISIVGYGMSKYVFYNH